MEEVSGYVLCVHRGLWWLACVLEKDAENAELKVTLLHPHGPSRSFSYPSIPDIIVLPLVNIITQELQLVEHTPFFKRTLEQLQVN